MLNPFRGIRNNSLVPFIEIDHFLFNDFLHVIGVVMKGQTFFLYVFWGGGVVFFGDLPGCIPQFWQST